MPTKHMFMGMPQICFFPPKITCNNPRFEGMIAREALTVIDHNSNLGRPQVCIIYKVTHLLQGSVLASVVTQLKYLEIGMNFRTIWHIR